jgi:hypothetical protein
LGLDTQGSRAQLKKVPFLPIMFTSKMVAAIWRMARLTTD